MGCSVDVIDHVAREKTVLSQFFNLYLLMFRHGMWVFDVAHDAIELMHLNYWHTDKTYHCY